MLFQVKMQINKPLFALFQVKAIGMSQYVDAFRKNAIDGAELKSLGHDTLQNSLNISKNKNFLGLIACHDKTFSIRFIED